MKTSRYITTNGSRGGVVQAAMTLIELSVVIGLIMALLGVLLIGYRFYVDSCNRCECLVVQSQVQKQYRSYSALHQNQVQAGVSAETLIAAGIYDLEKTNCKSGGLRQYMGDSAMVPQGQRVFPCQGVQAAEHAPEPNDMSGW